MAALEEPAIEREGSSINRSSFDVQTFCQRHLKCKGCNKCYVDPIILPCLHTYCSDCSIEKAADKKGNLREERVVARESLSASIQSDAVIQREGEERADEEEGMVSEDEDQEEGEREAGIQEVEEESVLHGNEYLTAPHDCDGDNVQSLVSRPLSNIIHAAKLKEQGEKQCDNCQEDIAKWICNDSKCFNILLCTPCRQAHARTVSTRNHEVIEINPETDWWKGVKRYTWFCSKHDDDHDRPVNTYCTVHDVLLCERCALLDHTNNEEKPCNLKDVDEYYNDADNAKILELQKVEELNQNFKTAIQRGEDRKTSLETKCNDIIAAVNERYDQLVQQLTVERDEAIAKANLICDLKKKEIDDHQAVLKRVTETLEDSLEFIKDFSNIANPAEFLFLKTQLQQRLDYLHDRYSTFDLSPADDDELYWKPSNDDLPTKMFGKIYSTPSVKKFAFIKHHQNKCNFNVVITVECRDISGGPAASESILPVLKAVITKSKNNITDGLACKVKPNNETRRYNITVPPTEEAGLWFIHVYQPRPYPLKQYYTQGYPFRVLYQ